MKPRTQHPPQLKLIFPRQRSSSRNQENRRKLGLFQICRTNLGRFHVPLSSSSVSHPASCQSTMAPVQKDQGVRLARAAWRYPDIREENLITASISTVSDLSWNAWGAGDFYSACQRVILLVPSEILSSHRLIVIYSLMKQEQDIPTFFLKISEHINQLLKKKII